MENEKQVQIVLSEQEQKIIQLIRNLGYGQLVINVKDSKPVHVEEVRKSIPLK